jgi:chromosome segregation ATPase
VTGNGDAASAFAELKTQLEGPLAGMGTAFSSSLFGLAGALALGVLELQAGQAQNRFFSDLEEFLAGRAELPEAEKPLAEENAAPPAYVEALLAQVAENLAQMQRTMARGDEERRTAQAGLAQLTDRLADLADQLRAQQKVIMTLEKSRGELQPAVAELTHQVALSVASNEELRSHLRSVDQALGRLLAEVAGARQQMPDAMRQEIRLLARSLGHPTLPHA